jgi:hypothetical protein
LSGLVLLFRGVYLLTRQQAPDSGPESSELETPPILAWRCASGTR